MYFDNNATTPLHPEVIASMQGAYSLFGNPSSIHAEGQKSRTELIQARRAVAQYLAVQPQEIFFTSGGTEGLNALILGLQPGKKGTILSSSLEHTAVLYPLQARPDCNVVLLKGCERGAVSCEQIEQAITPDTLMIVLMAVNNETGVKTPWREIAALAEQRNIPFILDGVALLGKEPLAPLPRGVTAVSFSAHKIHGPKGSGFFFLRAGTPFSPLIRGGGQEAQKRGGTENLQGILGLKKAIELLQNPPFDHVKKLRDTFEAKLQDAIPLFHINGSGDRICNVSNIAFDGVDGESLLFNLDLQGIQASHGSACSSGSLEPSRILLSMGYPLARARSSIRFSFSRFNTLEEIDKLVAVLHHEVKKLVSTR